MVRRFKFITRAFAVLASFHAHGRREYWFWAVLAVWLALMPLLAKQIGGLAAALRGVGAAAVCNDTTLGFQRSALLASDLAEVAKAVALAVPSAVVVTPKDGVIHVSIKDGAAYPDWMYALSILPGMRHGALWEVAKMCVGRGCSGGDHAHAEIIGFELLAERK